MMTLEEELLLKLETFMGESSMSLKSLVELVCLVNCSFSNLINPHKVLLTISPAAMKGERASSKGAVQEE